MSDSYASLYAKLAAEGINILNIEVDSKNGDKFMVFEYSWNDPKQDNKLHWSKCVEHGYNLKMICDTIISKVQIARKELERGE